MPWHKVENHAECPAGKPWAVVKDSDGSVAGCHANESEANDHMKALYANESGTGTQLGGKPKPGTPPDKRLHENPGGKKGADGKPVDGKPVDGKPADGKPVDETDDTSKKKKVPPPFPPKQKVKATVDEVTDEFVSINFDKDTTATEVQTTAPWEGVICVEGVTTGDGREFAPESLSWGDLPVPLRWNKEDSHGGMPSTVAVNVGNITAIERDGNQIKASGNIDLSTEDGRTVYGKIKGEFLRGVSIDADSITDADMEMIFPDTSTSGEEKSEADELIEMLFAMPEKVIFHAGRIRAATLCDIPAFVEAYIQLTDETLSDATVAALAARPTVTRAVALHTTGTSDAAWDSTAHVKRLALKRSTANARAASAWCDTEDGGENGGNYMFLHHEIAEDGAVGPANLTACAAGIAALNGNRDSTTLSLTDRRAVYAHLAKHLRDAGREAPPASFETAVTAAAAVDDRPPAEWFTDPKLSLPTTITVTDDGRVYGHAAMWGECHVGIADACVTPPFEDSHPYYMTGEVACADDTRVAVGQITLGTGHASLSLGASQAADHYDNTGSAVADVAVGNDEHGIWVAGAVRPGTDVHRVRELRASGQVSGDWRRIGGQLRLVGLLAVNVPGYPVPKIGTRVASGAQLALVAAGRPNVVSPAYSESELVQLAMRTMRSQLAARVGRVRKEV
jgi:hypothetical protein